MAQARNGSMESTFTEISFVKLKSNFVRKIAVIACLFGATAFISIEAQSLPAAEPAVKGADKPGPDSKKESLKQGFSVQESVLLGADSAWSTLAKTGVSRTLDELSYTTLYVNGTVGYRLTENDSIGVELSYGVPTELEVSVPEYFGMRDLKVRWTKASVFSDPRVGSISSLVTWEVPTSTLSQRETMISRVGGELSLRRPMDVTSPLRNLSLLASLKVALTAHQYDRRAIGPDVNSPFGLSYQAGATYNLLKGVNLTSIYALSHRVDYQGFIKDIQAVTVFGVVTLPSSFYFVGGYQWKDTVVTNDPFLDADKTQAFLELSRAF